MEDLLELLTVLIAFATVMLLLSLIVTALVQAIQNLFQLRARNLQRGLVDLLATAGKSPSDAETLGKAIVSAPELVQAKSGVKKTSWIRADELVELLVERKDGFAKGGKEIERVERWFERFEANLSKRFLAMTRWIALGCSLLVAVVFQVDAFATLRTLSADAAVRERLAASASEVMATAEERFREMGDQRRAAEEALLRLEREVADDAELVEALEEVGGVGRDRAELEAELRSVVESHPDADRVVERYGELLDGVLAERARRATRARDEAMALGARLDLSPWPHGRAFLFDGWLPRPLTWLGVLATTLLLSLGAPFWFDRLKRLVELRDTLRAVLDPKERERGRGGR